MQPLRSRALTLYGAQKTLLYFSPTRRRRQRPMWCCRLLRRATSAASLQLVGKAPATAAYTSKERAVLQLRRLGIFLWYIMNALLENCISTSKTYSRSPSSPTMKLVMAFQILGEVDFKCKFSHFILVAILEPNFILETKCVSKMHSLVLNANLES